MTIKRTLIISFLASGLSFSVQAAERPIDQVNLDDLAENPDTLEKIVGGEPAPAGKYPFQVALIVSQVPEGQEQRGQFCGGSLIDQRWVLTAAHCVPNTEPDEMDVYIGSTILPTDPSETEGAGIRMHVEQIVSHPGYDASTQDNDIALLKLLGPAPDQLKTATVATTELAEEHGANGDDVTVIGWGTTTEGGSTTPRLMQVTVQVQDRQQCQDNYQAFIPGIEITENMFCAGVPEGGKDSCQGDSGGFIGAPTGEGNYVQLGVVSWGIGCARPSLFGVYTQVANYGSWIEETMQSN